MIAFAGDAAADAAAVFAAAMPLMASDTPPPPQLMPYATPCLSATPLSLRAIARG